MPLKIFSFQFQSILFVLPFIISSVKSSCLGFQSKSQCLGSELPCCWIQYKFSGELVKECIVNDGSNDYNNIKTNPDFSDYSQECSGQPVKDNCKVSSNSPTESECLNAKGDCCFLTITTSVDFEGYDQEDFSTKSNECHENLHGTEKAYENGFKKIYFEEIKIEGNKATAEESSQIKAKCKKNSSSFYSLCMEQSDENSCLKADSNCCWVTSLMKKTEKGTHGASASNGFEGKSCEFNQFTSASLKQNFIRSIISHSTSGMDTSKMEREYDYKCSKHDYALYGGSGKVTKDGENPMVTYAYESTGEKGEKELSEALKDYGSMISFGYGNKIFMMILIGLILFK